MCVSSPEGFLKSPKICLSPAASDTSFARQMLILSAGEPFAFTLFVKAAFKRNEEKNYRDNVAENVKVYMLFQLCVTLQDKCK